MYSPFTFHSVGGEEFINKHAKQTINFGVLWIKRS